MDNLNILMKGVDTLVTVVGAGFTGLYALHKLRDQMKVPVRVFESAPDVGGTWYWNNYPGARCDIESIHYSYSFDEKLQQEWTWTEKFAAQPEILKYLNHVADRFDLRKDIHFNTKVSSVVWNEPEKYWLVTTNQGEVIKSRFMISGVGTLSVPKKPEFPGVENFKGPTLITSNWPKQPVSLKGKRVAVIGTGSTGIQLITEIAKEVGELYVFQRTPNYSTPLGNAPNQAAEDQLNKKHYSQIRYHSRNHFLGVPYNEVQPSALAVSDEERLSVYENRYYRGGFRLFIDSYQDILFDTKANETVSEYIRQKIHQRVHKKEVAELLAPQDYCYGTKRPPMESGYYEVFNQNNVHLVDVKKTPITRIEENGVVVGDKLYEVDILILATGFDAMTGPLFALGLEGKNKEKLADKWKDGPRTYLGHTVSGFPNLFLVTGPQSPSVLYNMPLAIEDHVDLATGIIQHMLDEQLLEIDAEAQAEEEWVNHANELAQASLLPNTDSWYMGANIPGKPRRCLVYLGGAPKYREICDEVVSANYKGFKFVAAADAHPAFLEHVS